MSDELTVGVPAGSLTARLIQRARDAEAQRDQLQRMFDACQRVEQQMAERIARLERVREAAARLITEVPIIRATPNGPYPAGRLLTELRDALAATESDA